MTRALVCGWFSVDGGEATAGDLLARDEVCDLLADAGCTVDVATNAGFTEGVRLDDIRPDDYQWLVFVCGPLHGARVTALLERFPHARTVAVNVSIVDAQLADRFDLVLPRDGNAITEPDLTLGRRPAHVPVVGVVRAHPQPEYDKARHHRADDAIRMLLASRPCATVDFDTRVHPSADPLAAHARSSAEVTTLAGRMDVVVTTRLHGMVLALGQGVPVVAIDPIAGGAKIARQARALDWPCCFLIGELHPEHLAEALTWCLTDEARQRAGQVVGGAAVRLAALRRALTDAVTTDPPGVGETPSMRGPCV